MSEKNNSEITKTSQGLTQQKPMLPFSFSIHRTAIRIYFALQRVSLSLLAIVYLLISNLRHTYLFWVTQVYNRLAGLFFCCMICWLDSATPTAPGGWNSIPFSNSSIAHSVMYAIRLLTTFADLSIT